MHCFPIIALHEVLEPVLKTVPLSTVEEQLRSVVLLAFGYEQSRLAKLCTMQWPVAHVDSGAMQAALSTLHGHLLCAYLSKVGHERAGSDPNYNLEHDPQLLAFLTELTNLQNNDPKAAAAMASAAANATATVSAVAAAAPAPAGPRPTHSANPHSNSGHSAAAGTAINAQKPRLTPAQQFQRASSSSLQQQATRGAQPAQASQTARSHDSDRSRSADQKRSLLGAGPRPQLPGNAGLPTTPTSSSQSSARQGPDSSWARRDSPIVPGVHPHQSAPQNNYSGSSSSTTSTPVSGAGNASGVGSASVKARAPSLLQSTPSPIVHSSSPLLPKPSGNNSRATAPSTSGVSAQQNRLSQSPLSNNQTPSSVGVGSPTGGAPNAPGHSITAPLESRSSGDSTDSGGQKQPVDSVTAVAAPPPVEEKPAAQVEELPLGPPGLRFKKFAYSNSLESEAN